MLETNSLLLRPAAGLGHSQGGRWRVAALEVCDPRTGLRLGSVRNGSAPPARVQPFASRAFEVYETEDECLVFSATRAWFLPVAWVVRDAFGKYVGNVLYAPNWLLRVRAAHASGGEVRSAAFATASRAGPDGEHRRGGKFFSGAGRELAAVSRSPEGTLLTFASQVEEEPFAKMMLLAATLIDL